MSILVAPLEALTDSLLSDPERRVLLALFSYRGKVTELVFPSLDALADRSLIKDKTRVSKITTSLANKGWLTKKKKGFTGCNQYTMCMPERLTNLDSETNLALETNLDADTNSNLAPETKYDVGTRDQVQVTDQLTNHVNKPIKKKSSIALVIPEWLDGELLNDFIDMRKAKKNPMTQKAISLLINKISEAFNDGHDTTKMLENAIVGGWQSVYTPKDDQKQSNRVVVNQPSGYNDKQIKNKNLTHAVFNPEPW